MTDEEEAGLEDDGFKTEPETKDANLERDDRHDGFPTTVDTEVEEPRER